MTGLEDKTWVERWLAPVAGAMVFALVGQSFATIWWVRGQADEISQLHRTAEALKLDHERMDSRLISADLEIKQRIEVLDRNGTRAMASVTENQSRLFSMVERMADRINTIDQRLSAVEGRGLTQLQADVKRLDEQQTRILQVLDNQYNMLNEFIRQYAHGPVPTGPLPKVQPEQDKAR